MVATELDFGDRPDGSVVLDEDHKKPLYTKKTLLEYIAGLEASEDYGSSKSGNYGHKGTPGTRGGSAPGTTVNMLGTIQEGGPHGVTLDDWEGDRKAVANMALYHYDSGSDRLALVEHKGEVVGVIGLSRGRSKLPGLDGEFVELYDVATKRPGFGHQTMAHAAKLAADDGMGLQLTAIKQAVGFYDKAGMHRHPLWGTDDKRAWMVERKFYWTADETKAMAEQFSSLAELEPESGVFVHTPEKDRAPQEDFGSSKSGNWSHKGTPGTRGGSAPGGASVGFPAGSAPTTKREELDNAVRKLNVLNDDLQQASKHQQATKLDRMEAKHEIVKAIAEETGLDYTEVNDLVARWSDTAGDSNPYAMKFQMDAAEEFGIKTGYYEKLKVANSINTPAPDRREFGRLDKEGNQKVARAMYDNTQALLKEKGFEPGETVRLRRGVLLDFDDTELWKEGDIVKVDTLPLSSWSATPGTEVAYRFASPASSARRPGYIIESDVPVESIFSTARTGVGCLTEGEFVVLGSEHEVKILRTFGK